MSTTPKIYLHDLTADHKDEVLVDRHCHDQHVTKVEFTCDCNNLVSTSPYTEEPAFVLLAPLPAVLAVYKEAYAERVAATTIIYSSLRGPPSFTSNVAVV